MILFDHKDIDLPKWHVTKLFNQSTFRKNVVILAFIRAEMAGRGGHILPPPPSRTSNSEPHYWSRIKARSELFLQLALNTTPLCAL